MTDAIPSSLTFEIGVYSPEIEKSVQSGKIRCLPWSLDSNVEAIYICISFFFFGETDRLKFSV